MNYSTHRITQTGHIELREVMEGGGFHRSVIAPNQPLEKYNDIIEADSDYAKYRTPENAEAYEASLVADQPSEEELLEQWRSTFKTDLYKLKIVLDTMGDLEDVESIIAQQPKGVQLAWENANSIRRNSPTVAGLAQAMEYSDETLDTIFKQADEVKL
jgi:hypothetical protein